MRGRGSLPTCRLACSRAEPAICLLRLSRYVLAVQDGGGAPWSHSANHTTMDRAQRHVTPHACGSAAATPHGHMPKHKNPRTAVMHDGHGRAGPSGESSWARTPSSTPPAPPPCPPVVLAMVHRQRAGAHERFKCVQVVRQGNQLEGAAQRQRYGGAAGRRRRTGRRGRHRGRRSRSSGLGFDVRDTGRRISFGLSQGDCGANVEESQGAARCQGGRHQAARRRPAVAAAPA